MIIEQLPRNLFQPPELDKLFAAPQVLQGGSRAAGYQDAPDDRRILDQRNDPHRAPALGALQRIDLLDLADQPRQSGFRASRKIPPACGKTFFARSPRTQLVAHHVPLPAS